MKRKIYSRILEWKQHTKGKTALLIQGARRVGKSYIAEEFAKNEYESYLIVDFSIAPPEVIDLFKNYRHKIDFLLERLQLIYGVKLHERHSLIIMDEVQFCPEARASVKQLVADGRYDYIETGSLISIKQNVRDILIPSEEEPIDMFPMDFEEFLWAKGETMLSEFIRRQFQQKEALGPSLHPRALTLFREYLSVGGMPQAVESFVKEGDFNAVEKIKRNIIELYRADISKFAYGESHKVKAIFDEIPGQLQNHETKFKLSSLTKEARMRNYKDAFFWLSDAYIINCCYNSTAPNIGLRLNENRTSMKCYMGDTGLLVSMAYDEKGEDANDIYRKIVLGKLEVNEGMLMENIVAQMFRASGHRLYFYSRKDNKDSSNTMEIDFLLAKSKLSSRHNIIPIEVKSGKRYTYTSLEKLKQKYERFISTPVILHDKDLKEERGILFLPLYMAGFMK